MAALGDGVVAYVGGTWADKDAQPHATAALYKDGAWTALPNMTTPRDSPGACAIDGTLYAFGGTTAYRVPSGNLPL